MCGLRGVVGAVCGLLMGVWLRHRAAAAGDAQRFAVTAAASSDIAVVAAADMGMPGLENTCLGLRRLSSASLQRIRACPEQAGAGL